MNLGMIVKDEVMQVKQIIKDAEPYVDGIYITCTHKPSLQKFKKLEKGKVHVDYFKWVEDFAAARNHNLQQIPKGWFFWVDSDDYTDFSKLPEILKEAEQESADAVYLAYDYAQDETGETITKHWRERLVNTKKPVEWVGPVHETLIFKRTPHFIRSNKMVIHHDNRISPDNVEQTRQKSLRNHKILEREYPKGDPRIAHYLAMSYFNMQEFEKAIPIFEEHIQKSGSTEDKYRSQIYIGLCYAALNHYSRAVSAELIAIDMQPSWPDAYFYAAQHHYEQKEYDKCLEFLKMGFAKEIPETFSVLDPTIYSYRSTMLAAMANFQKGKFDVAHSLLMEVLNEAPEYPLARKMQPLFEEEAIKKAQVEAIKKLSLYFDGDEEFQKGLYEILPDMYKEDVRLVPLKNKAVPPKVWEKGSVVFYCGTTTEPWGPDYLENGIGGSEEAVIYLSRELARLGKSVTVYNTRDEAYSDIGDWGQVEYCPWHLFDVRAQYSNLVLWRMPEFAKVMKADNLLVDLHDVVEEKRVDDVVDIVDTFMVKSNYHKSLFNIPEEKVKVVTNGILLEQFDLPEEERTIDVGYFSAPNRGLKTLLKDIWPIIQKKRPGTTGIWNYGWESYIGVNGTDDLYREIKALLEEHKDTFVEGGRISHTSLAKTLHKTKIWAYPTEFTEINCITALKAQQAGVWPVVTNVAALQETVQTGTKFDVLDIYTDKQAQERFADEVIARIEKDSRSKPMKGVSWQEVAKEWLAMMV